MTADLSRLASLPGVGEAIDEAREACTRLRWHEALRRRVPEVAAESRVRGARASAFLEGAEVPVDLVRDAMRGAVALDDGPGDRVLTGAIRATAETEHLGGVLRTAPAQAIATLHKAAAAAVMAPDALARPRQGDETPSDLAELGAAPPPAEAAQRLRGVVELIASLGEAPGILLTAIVHAEVATARPFGYANALVARALERALLQASGVDPVGGVVSEAGHARQGAVAYQGALSAYLTGSTEGVGLWLRHCAQAVVAGAAEATEIADAVLAGRLTGH
ncbi:hypothetical protein [Flexivirga caeni]|uniref:Fido domain-containing protein n=1 Tax=Flexivirga caeni TaxID=2294115 RepID=A0A3M9LZF2_9MICO|nr:hypothetical protein [Flexivirga caeni]RNI18305.1 hypothetical protein EFY87_18075 [Flexivirga caeni]